MRSTLRLYQNGSLLKEINPETKDVFYIGRANENDLVVGSAEKGVSRRHAKLELVGTQWWLEECGSSYGTYINGRRISREALPDHITVKLGKVELSIESELVPDLEGKEASWAEGKHKRQLSEAKRVLRDGVRNQPNFQRWAQENLSDEELEERVRSSAELLIDKKPEVFAAFSDEEKEALINGKIRKTEQRFEDEQHLLRVIERIITPVGRRIDEASPLVDARLPDGSRVNAVIPPISPDGAYLTIRKFGKDVFDVERLLKYGSLTPQMAEFLKICVQARKNIVVSGGTGSGKTSLLNSLSLFIDESERIVTIEDSLELKLQQEHVARLEARPPNPEGRGEITIRRLVKNALRMRPDRIIVGECRGGEALDMLQAMNTGHDGSLTTVHANSPRDVISRLETLTLMAGMDLPLQAVRNQIVSAVDLIVHTARLPDGSRKIVQITEVLGLKDGSPELRDIFRFRRKGIDGKTGKVIGEYEAVNRPSFAEELKEQGFAVKDEWFT